jgi:hypothetical protein
MTPLTKSLDEVVIDKLQSRGPCFLEDLVKSLPALSWGQVFSAVDRMSKNGRLWLRQVGYSTYAVIPYPQLKTPEFDVTRMLNIQQGRFPDQGV